MLRFVRARFPRPRVRPFRRVETPAGAQAQVDWSDVPTVDVGRGPELLRLFVMTLSFSRKTAAIWCRRMDQLHWQHAHNEAFRRLGGIPAVLRIDNLKTGVARGAGAWGEINEAYRSYARCVGFHVDPCRVRNPQDKGKVERRIGAVKFRLDLTGRHFPGGLEELQGWSDERLNRWDRRRLCPVTGRTVEQTWREEQSLLRPVDGLPEVFDTVATRKVDKDSTVQFEGRCYSVPFLYTGREVEARGCVEVVQFFADGFLIAEHPRGTERRLLIEPTHYEGEGDERVAPPVPLGKLGQRLVDLCQEPVEHRAIDLYARLAEVAR